MYTSLCTVNCIRPNRYCTRPVGKSLQCHFVNEAPDSSSGGRSTTNVHKAVKTQLMMQGIQQLVGILHLLEIVYTKLAKFVPKFFNIPHKLTCQDASLSTIIPSIAELRSE